MNSKFPPVDPVDMDYALVSACLEGLSKERSSSGAAPKEEFTFDVIKIIDVHTDRILP
jgi:hypothetical protein